MSQTDDRAHADVAPGDEYAHEEFGTGLRSYLIGLALALLLTAASFWVAQTEVMWAPALPVALLTFAIAQMGVHLVFFLHLTSGPDNTNNIMALAFGVLIVFLLFGGSVWIMHHMNTNMMAPVEGGVKRPLQPEPQREVPIQHGGGGIIEGRSALAGQRRCDLLSPIRNLRMRSRMEENFYCKISSRNRNSSAGA